MEPEVPPWIMHIVDYYAALRAADMPVPLIARIMHRWTLKEKRIALADIPVRIIAADYTALRAADLPAEVIEALIDSWYIGSH